ncbi:MAG: pilus assembly protein [Rickettsiales bacterium]|nr:pilus assembly protein [Rickettsiales bacterium]
MITTLIKHCEAASTLEFAIIAPMVLLVLLTGIELGMISFAGVVVESATTSVTNQARLGRQADDSMDDDAVDLVIIDTPSAEPPTKKVRLSIEEQIRNAVHDYSAGLLDKDLLVIDTTPIMGTGQSGDYVQYNVYYPLPLLTPIGSVLFGEKDGRFVVESVALVLDENL